ncbi:hypothetical protein SERLADRAFT_471933 [Serpula lacrymans var. lacrymans S7.9]|nr:uncharacterized protein SERLADRAFT_471933 [Serpula lacrymans var. lacrymans S7.9]EGO23157.1 hypothetical protein SERLADRAFT_471933 [Serpula lacrymans var. lacrymans S7.9]
MPSDIPWLSHAFPFASTTAKLAENTRGTLLSFLPRASTTRNIADMYYKHAAFLYTPIPESEFHESIFLRIYHPDLVPDNGPANSHRLAVLFMVLALGTLMDLDKPSHSQESKQYYQLGRAALSLDSVFEEQSIISIQALFLMCHFMFLSDIEGPRWALMGLVVKLAQGIGLHRDSGKWNLESEETQKRRTLMWEIYTYDSWQSLTFGRPPSFALAHIDCQMAYDTTRNEAGEVEMSFAAWKHRFSSQCLSTVQDQAFGARTPSYKTIQQLDRQVREFYLPPSLQVPGFGNSKIGKEVEQPSIQLTMQRYLAFAIREITLFYMHRGFFARAVEDHPDDPLGSKYAPSVLAAYSSACSFVGLIESLYSQHPAITERMWFLFTHVFSCAIVLGAIATKNQMALAPSALSHLESANHLFEQVSENPRASKIIPIIQNLRRRAQSAIVEDKGRIMDSFRVNYFGSIKNEIDKLSSLGGMTRLVSRRKNSSHPSPGNDNRGSQSPTSISPTVNRSSSLPLKESTPPSALETFSPWQQNFGHFHHSPHSTPSYPPVPSMHEQGMYNGHTDAHMTPQYFTTYNNPSPPGMEEWYSQSNMMPVQSPVDGYYPAADHLNASWQSFVAQYKPV